MSVAKELPENERDRYKTLHESALAAQAKAEKELAAHIETQLMLNPYYRHRDSADKPNLTSPGGWGGYTLPGSGGGLRSGQAPAPSGPPVVPGTAPVVPGTIRTPTVNPRYAPTIPRPPQGK